MRELPLKVSNLSKRFEQATFFWQERKAPFTAVNGISFELQAGEILGLLGPNGAGKTTTIQMLLGTMIPSSGTIAYFGKDLSQYRSDVLGSVAFASTYVRLPGRLTVYENLEFYAKIYGLSAAERAERIERYLKQFQLWHLKDRTAGALSAGEMTRALLAKAFLSHPKVVLLDEPTASLDPDIAHEVRSFIVQQQKERNLSILFTSHNMDEVAQICDRVLVLKQGSIIAADTPTALAASLSRARVQLVSEDLPGLSAYAQMQGLAHQLEGGSITVQIDEQQIAAFLTQLTKQNLTYTQISIEKPSLEDYFLSIAYREKGGQV